VPAPHRRPGIEQARRADDASAIMANVGRHLHRRGVRCDQARQLSRHPAIRVVDLQDAYDRVEAVADEQDGQNAHQLSRPIDVARRPEQRTEDAKYSPARPLPSGCSSTGATPSTTGTGAPRKPGSAGGAGAACRRHPPRRIKSAGRTPCGIGARNACMPAGAELESRSATPRTIERARGHNARRPARHRLSTLGFDASSGPRDPSRNPVVVVWCGSHIVSFDSKGQGVEPSRPQQMRPLAGCHRA
jgi:hypothetical protein